ncbi:MAG: hypothetical protein KA746_10560 [Pyrinomonadaceae bacterium]|nr:hypothetical protein [Pyrinomonadaceae bacterium]MBP6212267.1 hypothetical protein [Pyrinomonadaceae bacterium]
MRSKRGSTIIIFLVLLASASTAFGQALPKKILGYKVYQADITIGSTTSVGTKGQDASVLISPPSIVDLGWNGVTIEINGSLSAIQQSGRVDFITFRDFTINGVPVDVQEYRHSFAFKRGVGTSLPRPAQALVRTSSLAKAAFKEIIETKDEWAISGTALVFGRFNKYGMSFKRVVPVNVHLTIPNPVKSTFSQKN